MKTQATTHIQQQNSEEALNCTTVNLHKAFKYPSGPTPLKYIFILRIVTFCSKQMIGKNMIHPDR